MMDGFVAVPKSLAGGSIFFVARKDAEAKEFIGNVYTKTVYGAASFR